jgi:hypothetical protein
MLQANVKKSNLNYFVNLTLSGIKFEEFSYSLLFGFNKQMDVTTHWELVDSTTNEVHDRGMALKMREKLLIYKLITAKLTKFTKDNYQVILYFDNNLKLVVY